MAKLKIFNDPVHGFIEVGEPILLSLIDHPYLQRLRRIRQLAFTSWVYPGAVHTRFNHVLGAMHLTRTALETLRNKGIKLTDSEFEATLIAILLHDLGHPPFSHALERVLLPHFHHEELSKALIQNLNNHYFNQELTLALQIFSKQYSRPFLHQLVSSQLDMDRMDYLMRDSFFTGVSEGIVGTERIIKTLTVVNEQLVVEEKGIYSVEKFIIARRLMYWQVYLHKAVLASEKMLVNMVRRAKEIFLQNKPIWTNESLSFFFLLPQNQRIELTDEVLAHYTALDDEDILYAIKQWQHHPDRILSELANRLLNRRLLKLRFQNHPITPTEIAGLQAKFAQKNNLAPNLADFFVFAGEASNLAYLNSDEEPILILTKSGSLTNIATASDISNIEALAKKVVKYYICMPE
ncbi:MAG: HD domain-containing protein [Bacteroidia bacterium]|nr:HD domain-containing protein [Bacteroidia bacterium]